MVKEKILRLKRFMVGGVVATGLILFNTISAHAEIVKYADIPKGQTVKQLESASVKISKDKNPEYYTQSSWEQGVYLIDVAKLPFDGKIYSDERKSSIANSHKSFIRLMEMSLGSSKNSVIIKYGMTVVMDGQVNEGSPLTVEVTSAEKYNYLQNQGGNGNPSKPIEPSKPTEPNKPQENKKEVTRIWGDRRIETSIAIAEKTKEGKAKHSSVILAVSNDFPDALSGGVLNGKYDAPIVLVNKSADLSKLSLDYVKNNVDKNGNIIVLGGTGVIDDTIIKNLSQSGFKNIKRLGGSDRYATNLQIINNLNPAKGTPVIVSYSLDFPDALSISPIAAKNGYPIFLSRKDIDKSTLDAIKKIAPSSIYIVGSSGVISSSTENQLKSITKNVVRLGGSDRYKTSIAIAEHFNTDSPNVTIASSMDFPDALSGAYLAYKNDSSIIVVNSNNTALQKDFINKYKKYKINVLGGPGAVENSTIDKIIG